MAKKISQLTQATQVKSDDVTVIVQDGETKKLPLNMMVTKQDIENKKVAGLAKLDEIEATYENDTYTPTIAVKNKSSVKVGEGDGVDYSANVMDGPAKSAILTGNTLVNLVNGHTSLTNTSNVYCSFNDGVYTYQSKSSYTGSITPVNMLYLNIVCGMKQNTMYTLIVQQTTGGNSKFGIRITYSDNSIEDIGEQDSYTGIHKFTFTTSSSRVVSTLNLRLGGYTDERSISFKNIMILEGDYTNIDIPYFTGMQSVKLPVLTTSNEDGTKTNILTTPEEVVLRSLPNGVCDTLNVETGEYAQRIGEVVFDGSEDENWRVESSSLSYTKFVSYVDDENRKVGGSLWCNAFNGVASGEHLNTIRIGIGGRVVINTDKALTSETFKQWLSQNPITVQYELATPIIKTVDLMPSGTHPSTTPYCWKNGHIQLSSSGLLPNLEYSVVTSRAGQINQNATMIVKNDKRIFDLEILLAGGLVNTTYQALTLQNQVETGLSKVSLSSETEPDYLLYHMIMKLIEEKAYKLDDLTEKVSVFYLYEKLSDEQFETIYSALYPFVEDEIIEEPVVEELPEVVEDEVIM